MPLYGSSTRAGVPIAYSFMAGGNAVNWGTNNLMSMSDVSVRAEPIDGKLSISELRCSFSDTNGSIWGSLGHGTTFLGSSFSATVYVGGTMDYTAYGPLESVSSNQDFRLSRTNTGNSATLVIHKGRITDIGRKNRTVTITSKNAMSQIADLEWKFPVSGTQYQYDSQIGSNFFYSENFATLSAVASALFKKEDTGNRFSVYGFWGAANATLTTHYPTVAGRGTLGLATNFFFPGTQFYYDYNRFLFDGSRLKEYHGTIDNLDLAYSLGFNNLSESEAVITGNAFGSYYPVNKTRLVMRGAVPFNDNGSSINFQQGNFVLESTPATLWREMLTGHSVSHLFGSADIEPLSWATSVRNTAYQTYRNEIDPKGGQVLPYIKEILSPLQAMFSLDAQNLFRLHTFGPRNYSEVIGTLGASEIMDSEASVSEDDKYNRVVLSYQYKADTGSFQKKIERAGTGWAQTNDFTFSIESKWISNDNDAAITADRILQRFYAPITRLDLELPLNRMTMDVGSLFDIEDTDLSYTGRVFEVIGWKKNFTDRRSVQAELLDADAIYKIKGYAKFEGDNDMELAVSGTSTSGWGTNGTVNNINTAFYGNYFSWF